VKETEVRETGKKSEKFFNTAGPVIPEDHYILDPLRRVSYEEISDLIDQKRYFVLHAPRQTGKTTSLLAMAGRINEEGRYRCVYINVEAAQTARSDVAEGMLSILTELNGACREYPEGSFFVEPAELVRSKGAHSALSVALR
jgi:hypothetical protein